ncbi:unnamed protein product, partial [Brassica rapa]
QFSKRILAYGTYDKNGENMSQVVHFFPSMSYQQGRYRSRCKGPSTRIISMIFDNRKLMSRGV